jgi:hypothetical protein
MTLRDQNLVFNKSIANVEQANKDLTPLEFGTGLRTKERLEKLVVSLDDDIKDLKLQEAKIIVDGYVKNYENAYYGYGYSIEKDLNTIILTETPYDYTIGMRQLNTAYVRAAYVDQVANYVYGLGIKSRTRQEIIRVQSSIRKSVSQALVEGISPRELASRLKNVDIVYEQNLNHAFTVARTELLRGHSHGSEDAIKVGQDAGVKGKFIWDATLDGFTRPDHRKMDTDSRAGKQPDAQGFFVFPDGSKAQGPRLEGLSAKMAINCRCNKQWLVFGLTPNKRGSRLSNGDWKVLNKDLSYEEWSKTLEGKRNIEKARIYRRNRAARLAKLRAQKKKPPVIESIKKRLEITKMEEK